MMKIKGNNRRKFHRRKILVDNFKYNIALFTKNIYLVTINVLHSITSVLVDLKLKTNIFKFYSKPYIKINIAVKNY